MRKGLGWLALPLFVLTLGIAQAEPGKVTYVYTDAQGTPIAEADANGNITATFDYRPYGSQALGSAPTGPGYTGHVNDPDTGLLYMQARYYDPVIGRFLSRDPIGPTTGDLFNFNRFDYGNNNPINRIDPDGRTVTCDASSCTIHAHSALEVAVDYTTFAIIYTQRLVQNAISPAPNAAPTPPSAAHNETDSQSPTLPGGLVGVQDGKDGQQGGRINSGPLSPDHGGTGDSAKDFDKLTGGNSRPAAEGTGYPPGTTVGDNGIAHRPATGKAGPRIDIPANGDKSHETLHYPKPPPPPDPKPIDG